MKVIDKKTNKIINVVFAENPLEDGVGRFVDKNFQMYLREDLDFDVAEIPHNETPDNKNLSDKEMTYEIAKMILASGLKDTHYVTSDLVETSVVNAKKFVEWLNM